uniref:Uncharacterized protein n=2 Tax=viral metagenome TaxID=1070528 RepID=A0A6M3J190_9ZZZZ
MTSKESMSNGELFTDLQVTLTEIVLVKMIRSAELKDKYNDRLIGNKRILDAIKKIIADRFSDDDIQKFLEAGFPRQVNLGKVII